MKYDYSQSLVLVSEQNDLLKTVNHITRRTRLLDEIKFILSNNSTVNQAIIKAIGDIMDCTSSVLLLNEHGSLKFFICTGETIDTNSVESLAEYLITSYREIINIRDLQSEPLCSKKLSSHLKSCLICPVKSSENENLGALFFFNEYKEFRSIDEKLGEEICKLLSDIPICNYVNKSEFIERPIDSQENKGLVKSLYYYSLKKAGKLFDFGDLFKEIKRKICKLIHLDSCSVYLADQHENVL